MTDEIYQDKIRLSAVATDKELTLIATYADLLSLIKQRPEIIKGLKDYPNFLSCWQQLAELYDFLKNDYLDKVEEKEKKEIEEIMKKYTSLNFVSFDDLTKAKEIVLKIMSASGFHTVLRKEEIRGLEKIKKRYKLK